MADPAPATPVAPAMPPKPKPPTSAPATPKRYEANIFCSPREIPPIFAQGVIKLEGIIGRPIWTIVQRGPADSHSEINDDLVDSLVACSAELKGKKIAVLLDSPGGYAKSAFLIARTLRTFCGGFTVIVPDRAKSAATLLAIGSEEIILSQHGELGPLDAQIFETEREAPMSALDEVQALERLHTFWLESVDRAMVMLVGRTGKKVETLLPMVLESVGNMMRPLLEGIDVVHYTQMSRSLKVGEEYAKRLLSRVSTDPEKTARTLVHGYPDHAFSIDLLEAKSLGLKVKAATEEQEAIFDEIRPSLRKLTSIGFIKEVGAKP
jgi:Serine dehydrogenase proteinase